LRMPNSDRLAEKGLFLDMPPWDAAVFCLKKRSWK
jgi:hypothetical protein